MFTAVTQYNMNNVSPNILLIKILSYNTVRLIFIWNHMLTKVLTFLISDVTLQAMGFNKKEKEILKSINRNAWFRPYV